MILILYNLCHFLHAQYSRFKTYTVIKKNWKEFMKNIIHGSRIPYKNLMLTLNTDDHLSTIQNIIRPQAIPSGYFHC